jgi:hypothetical protein
MIAQDGECSGYAESFLLDYRRSGKSHLDGGQEQGEVTARSGSEGVLLTKDMA